MKKEFIQSFVIILVFLSLGFTLWHYDLIGYGSSFFVFLPFIIGYLLGKSLIKKMSLVGLFLSLIVFFVLLLAGKLEGMVCILMALPIIIISIMIGVLFKYIYLLFNKKKPSNNSLKFSALHFIIFMFVGFIESELSPKNDNIYEVATEMVLPYSTPEVFNAIKSVDTLDCKKPFLMKLDLPIPIKCVLENEKIGSLRTCYFKNDGKIVERISELKKNKILKMDVIESTLKGRKWLQFKEAIYLFETIDDTSSKITRITTYTSKLYPRKYWRPLEEIGFQQEHAYVLNNLRKDLDKQ